MSASNPFTPSFGTTPPLLVGRDDAIHAFAEALDTGVGDPYRAMLLTGTRGSGKTVLLNAMEDQARQRGWAVVSQTTRTGMLEEMIETRLPRAAIDALGRRNRSMVTGASATAFGVGASITRDVQPDTGPEPDLRDRLFALADTLDETNQAGVLISIDEVHRSALDDLRVIVQEIQHAFREGRQVAFISAGLPESVSDLLNENVLTFLRRAERYSLGPVDDSDVADALATPIARLGHDITDDALDIATSGTGGYPYLIQTVGYESWKLARSSTTITAEHARKGVEAARRRVGRLVHDPTLAALSAIDKSYLVAMAVDDGPSKTGDIARRIGQTPQYAGTYRKRLLEHGIINNPRYGYVDFTLPYLREYLREHAATEALT